MNTPDSSGWSQRTQRGIAGIGQRRLRDEERDPARVDRLAGGEGIALRDGARAPAAGRRISAPELALDDQLGEVLVGQALAVGRRGSSAAPGRRDRTWSSKKWANGPCPTSWSRPATRSVSTTSPSDGTGSRRASSRARPEDRVERPRPQPGLVHDAEAVGEARVLGRREDPAGALELADPAQALEPRACRAGPPRRRPRRAGRRRGLAGAQALGQLDVAVDGVADQVDRRGTGGGPSIRMLSGGSARERAARAWPATSSRSSCRREDLDLVAPRQDPQPDLDRARRPSPARRASRRPRSRPLGRVPGRLADAAGDRGAKRSTTSTSGWSAMMSQAGPSAASISARPAARTSAASAPRRGSARS